MVKENGIGCGFSTIKNDFKRTNFHLFNGKEPIVDLNPKKWIQSNGNTLFDSSLKIVQQLLKKKKSLVWKVLEKW